MKRFFALFLLLCCFGIIIINYQNDILLKLFSEKIWIHRVNSIEKLKEVNIKFNSVEVDVVFIKNKQIFDVNHPPTQSIDLSLFQYLSSIKLTSNNRFWLDFKNLSEDNMEVSCLKLDSLCKVFKLERKQFIVESSSHPKYLTLFNKKGYKTSQYIYGTLNEQRLEKIRKIRLSNITHYISSDKGNYSLIKENFPNDKILTWSYNYSGSKTLNPYYLFKNLRLMYTKYKVLSDRNVIVLLFRYDAKKGNR